MYTCEVTSKRCVCISALWLRLFQPGFFSSWETSEKEWFLTRRIREKKTIRRSGAKYSWQVLPQKNRFQSNCSITDTIAYSGFPCGMIFKWNYSSYFLHVEWGWRQVSNTQKCRLRFGLFQRDFWGLESQNFCRKHFYIRNIFTDSWNLQSSFFGIKQQPGWQNISFYWQVCSKIWNLGNKLGKKK